MPWSTENQPKLLLPLFRSENQRSLALDSRSACSPNKSCINFDLNDQCPLFCSSPTSAGVGYNAASKNLLPSAPVHDKLGLFGFTTKRLPYRLPDICQGPFQCLWTVLAGLALLRKFAPSASIVLSGRLFHVAWMKSSRQEAWCSHQCSKRIRFYPQCLNWICHPLPARQLRHELLQHQVVELHVFIRCFFPRPGDLRAQRTAHRAVKGARSLSMWRVWPLEKNPRWSQATKNEFGNQTTSTGSCSVLFSPQSLVFIPRKRHCLLQAYVEAAESLAKLPKINSAWRTNLTPTSMPSRKVIFNVLIQSCETLGHA